MTVDNAYSLDTVMKKQVDVKGGLGLVAMYNASLLELQEILGEQISNVENFYKEREVKSVEQSDKLTKIAKDAKGYIQEQGY